MVKEDDREGEEVEIWRDRKDRREEREKECEERDSD